MRHSPRRLDATDTTRAHRALLATALLLGLLSGRSALAEDEGERLLSVALSAGAPRGDTADDLALDAGMGVHVQYLHHLTAQWAFGPTIEGYRLEGGDVRRGPRWVDDRRSSARIAAVGVEFRFVVNPAGRVRAFVGGGRRYLWAELEERYRFTQSDPSFVDVGTVTRSSSLRAWSAEAGLAFDLTDRVGLSGSIRYAALDDELVQAEAVLATVLRF